MSLGDNVQSGYMCTRFLTELQSVSEKPQFILLRRDASFLTCLAMRHDSEGDWNGVLGAFEKSLGPTRGIIVPSCVEVVPTLFSGFCFLKAHPWTTTTSLHSASQYG